jgi:DNA-directed RNA polymerase subunit RPC12/RpoP
MATNRAGFPVVLCSTCHKAMDPVLTEAGPMDMHMTTYRCERCGTEVQHAFTDTDLPSGPSKSA